MPATQKTFDRTLAAAPFRPTVGMDGAKHLLDASEDEVMGYIEEGLLSHAWNIGLGHERKEPRILRAAIDAFLYWSENPKRGRGLPATAHTSDAAVLKLLLPPGHTKPFLTNPELQRSLNCVSEHVLNLVESRELELLPGTSIRRGPDGAALVTTASFARFIKTRRLPL